MIKWMFITYYASSEAAHVTSAVVLVFEKYLNNIQEHFLQENKNILVRL